MLHVSVLSHNFFRVLAMDSPHLIFSPSILMKVFLWQFANTYSLIAMVMLNFSLFLLFWLLAFLFLCRWLHLASVSLSTPESAAWVWVLDWGYPARQSQSQNPKPVAAGLEGSRAPHWAALCTPPCMEILDKPMSVRTVTSLYKIFVLLGILF